MLNIITSRRVNIGPKAWDCMLNLDNFLCFSYAISLCSKAILHESISHHTNVTIELLLLQRHSWMLRIHEIYKFTIWFFNIINLQPSQKYIFTKLINLHNDLKYIKSFLVIQFNFKHRLNYLHPSSVASVETPLYNNIKNCNTKLIMIS